MPIFVANEKNTVKGRKQPCFSLLFTLTKLFMYELVGHTSVITHTTMQKVLFPQYLPATFYFRLINYFIL